MNYYLKTLIVFVLFLNILNSCGNNNNGKSENINSNIDTLLDVKLQKLQIEDYDFSILENRKFIQYNKAIYQRGDEIYFVLKNVGIFSKGTDGLNRAEMKLEVFDAIGQTITVRNNLFGISGHADFKNNTLKAPYASYTSTNSNKIGKYTIKITVYDIIKGDSVSISDDFFLE